MSRLVLGIKNLDEVVANTLYPGATIVIAGHPGAGKTTFATTVCHSNALNGKRCLYLSFQESKSKLYRVAKSLGMDLEKIEKEGLYKFVNLPLTSSCEAIADSINKILSEYKPDIVVIDSINAVLEPIKDPHKRAWLQNYFYQLSEMIKGLAIIIAELPYGEEKLGLGAIEFVSDAVFVLKHYIIGGKLVRLLEIRKARGTQISVAEIPFQITEGVGIKVFVPPLLKEIKGFVKPFKFTTSILKKYIVDIYAGESILLATPPYARIPHIAFTGIDLALTNDLKTLIISYRYGPDELKTIITSVIKSIVKEEIPDELVEKYMVYEGLNPYGVSIEELLMTEMELVEQYDPDIVVFHGVEILNPLIEIDPYRYYNLLTNQLYYLKNKGKIIIRHYSYINEEHFRMQSSLSDIVIRVFLRSEEKGIEPYIYVWRRGKLPVTLSFREAYEEIAKCLPDIIKKFLERNK